MSLTGRVPLRVPLKSKKALYDIVKGFSSGHVRSRTLNLLIRSQMLYPIELHNHFPVMGVQR